MSTPTTESPHYNIRKIFLEILMFAAGIGSIISAVLPIFFAELAKETWNDYFVVSAIFFVLANSEVKHIELREELDMIKKKPNS